MDVTQTQQTQTNQTDASNDSAVAQDLITADFEAFLQLLTTQLENQDPLDPMSSEDLATQLATFSGVEQQVRTNELLEDLTAGFQLSSLGELSGWLGQEARADMPVYYDGDPVTLTLDPPSFADQAQLVVTNADGLEVRRVSVDVTDEPMTFLGYDNNGQDLPDGVYTFTMEAYAGGELIETEGAQVYAEVREVFQRGSETWITLAGGVQINAASVEGLRAPDEAQPN